MVELHTRSSILLRTLQGAAKAEQFGALPWKLIVRLFLFTWRWKKRKWDNAIGIQHTPAALFPFFRANRIISIHLEKNITATHATAWRPFFVVVYCLASNKLLRLSLSIRIVFIPLSRRCCCHCCFIRDGVTSSLPLLSCLFKLTL